MGEAKFGRNPFPKKVLFVLLHISKNKTNGSMFEIRLEGYKLISQFVSITFAPLNREACTKIMRYMFLIAIQNA